MDFELPTLTCRALAVVPPPERPVALGRVVPGLRAIA
jgi:hypothetical protein